MTWKTLTTKRGMALLSNFNASSIQSSGGFLKSQKGFQPRNPSRSATGNMMVFLKLVLDDG